MKKVKWVMIVAVVVSMMGEFQLEATQKGESNGTANQSVKALTLTQMRDIKTLTAKAKSGDAYAQAILGESYARGELGVKENGKEAMKWLLLAEKQNHPLAFYNLGRIYESGLCGVKKDEVKGKEYFKRAFKGLLAGAETADPRWLCNLGYLCNSGRKGIPQNLDLALKYYKKSIKGGYPRATNKVSTLETQILINTGRFRKAYDALSNEERAEKYGYAYKKIPFGISVEDFKKLEYNYGKSSGDEVCGSSALNYCADLYNSCSKDHRKRLTEYIEDKFPVNIYKINDAGKTVKFYFIEPVGLNIVLITFDNMVPSEALVAKINAKYNANLKLENMTHRYPCSIPMQLSFAGCTSVGLEYVLPARYAEGNSDSQKYYITINTPDLSKASIEKKGTITFSNPATMQALKQKMSLETAINDLLQRYRYLVRKPSIVCTKISGQFLNQSVSICQQPLYNSIEIIIEKAVKEFIADLNREEKEKKNETLDF